MSMTRGINQEKCHEDNGAVEDCQWNNKLGRLCLDIDSSFSKHGSVFPHLRCHCPLPVTSSPWFIFCLLEVKLTSISVNSAGWFKMRTRVSLLLVPVLSSNEF